MLVLNWARFSLWSKCFVLSSNKIQIFLMEIFGIYSKIAKWVSSISFKKPLDLNEGVLRFLRESILGGGEDYFWFKSSAVCQCVLYKILSWACYLDFCSVVSKNVQKWDTLVESFTFSTVWNYSTVGPGFETWCGILFLKNWSHNHISDEQNSHFFVLFVFVNHWQCVKLFYLFFFQFCTLYFFFLVRQNFTGANNLTKKSEGGILCRFLRSWT